MNNDKRKNADSALSTAACSEYPLPWKVDCVRLKNASVYAANSAVVYHLNGRDAERWAKLIVYFANQNERDAS